MKKMSDDNKKVILGIIQGILTALSVVFIIAFLVLSVVFIGVVFEVRPEYKDIFDNEIFESLNSVTAFAEEENVIAGTSYIIPIVPGAVLIYEDYEEELSPLWTYSGVGVDVVDLSSLNLTGGVYQVVCMAHYGDVVMPLTNLVYLDDVFYYQYFTLNDYGSEDYYFDIGMNLADEQLFFNGFINSFSELEGAYVSFYALYKIEGQPSSSGVNIDQISDIMFDGVSFSANAIASSISYTFENLFLNEDGTLTVYTQLILWFAGIGLLLSFVRMLTDWLFSLGGNKDKL